MDEMNQFGPSAEDALEDGSKGYSILSEEKEEMSDQHWVDLARTSWEKSDQWFDSVVRSEVEDSIRAFNSQHPSGSKYYSSAYEKRTSLFRPRTRGNMRKLEAAMAVALFSTSDAVAVEAFDQGNANASRLAQIKETLIRRRIGEKKFHWFTSIMSAFQSSCKERVAIGHVGWDYKTDDEGNIISDRPFFDAVPLELLRIDPGADFRDPINTSPYVIHRKPMYMHDLLEGMKETKDGPARYRTLSKSQLLSGSESDHDSLRSAREHRSQDRYNERYGNDRYQTVWVDHCIVNKDGHDYVYDVVGGTHLLTNPQRIENVYAFCRTGDRPYVVGTSVLEAFTLYPHSPVELGLPVQEEINELGNLTMDTIKLNTSKRYFVRRGGALDVATMLRSVPGSIIFTNNPDQDIREETTKNIPSGVFQERDRLSTEMDDLNGTFMGSSVGVNRRLNETVGGMNLISEQQNQVQELTLRTFVETFAEPVLNMVMRAIEAYESDERVMMAVANEKRADLADVYDSLLIESVTRVQVGFGNINPQKRMERITMAAAATAQIMPDVLMQADRKEILAEIWGAAGYRDGSRFFPSIMQDDVDPEKQQLQQQIQELQMQIEMDAAKTEAQIQIATIREDGRLRIEQMRQQGQREIEAMRQQMNEYKEVNKMRLEEFDRMIAQAENERDTQRLRHEREALSHSISMAEREFSMRLRQMYMEPMQQRLPAPSGGSQSSDEFSSVPNQTRQLISSLRKPSSGSPVELGEPVNLPGNDRAGVIARDDYGKIPFRGG